MRNALHRISIPLPVVDKRDTSHMCGVEPLLLCNVTNVTHLLPICYQIFSRKVTK